MKKVAKVFGAGTKKPKVETPEEKPVTPLPDEDELKRQARLSNAQMQKSGRASTILSDEDEDLG